MIRTFACLCLFAFALSPLCARESEEDKKYDGQSAVLQKAFRENFLKKLKKPDPKNPPPLPADTSDEDWIAKVIEPAADKLASIGVFKASLEEEKAFRSGKFNNELNAKRLRLAMAKFKDRDARMSQIGSLFIAVTKDLKSSGADLELMMRIAEWEATALDQPR